ncbi:MAG: SDR family NAD(P)-dependent oxidoreductase [Gammaproteobacteria bacterium]|nr:SDR family NAD(P)-dependent oxidoreductase [Gammaproteobacteria bacterium]
MTNEHKKLQQDRVILVAGAGDGLGRTLALQLANEGATVLLLGKHKHKLNQVYDQIISKGGAQPVSIPFDLEKQPEAAYGQLATMINESFGRLDGFVYTATWLGALTPVRYYDPGVWHKSIQINLHAPFYLVRSLYELFMQSAAARLVYVSHDFNQSAYWGAYGAAKMGMENLFKSIAAENQNTQLTANIFRPGAMQTPTQSHGYPGLDQTLLPTADVIAAQLLPLLLSTHTNNGHIISAQAAELKTVQNTH